MRKKPSEQTIKKLFALSGNCCAFPNCSQSIVSQNGEIVGDICHIEAAKEGGERFNSAQTEDQRSSFENLILLCANHHRITNDVQNYTVDVLQGMKSVHEKKYTDNEYQVSENVIMNAIEILNKGEINLNFGNVHNANIAIHGLTVKDATSLFQVLFEANFPKLEEIAKQVAVDNVLKLKDVFLQNSEGQLNGDDLKKFSDPDLQFILNKAILTAARKDDAELRGNLSDLLIKRILLKNQEDLKVIIYNEAIETVGKLTTNQLKIITFVFLLRQVNFKSINSWQSFNQYLEGIIKPFLSFKNTETEFRHIEYTGCANISVLTWDLTDIFFKTYPSLFVDIRDLSLAEEAIKTNTSIGKELFEIWRNSQVNHMVLTSVGIVIAASYFEQVCKMPLNIDNWIN